MVQQFRIELTYFEYRRELDDMRLNKSLGDLIKIKTTLKTLVTMMTLICKKVIPFKIWFQMISFEFLTTVVLVLQNKNNRSLGIILCHTLLKYVFMTKKLIINVHNN
uniref:Transmembrane protein n=1 Tax=Heterorhabditis bacteriophora TaxID=37862 RepID=A0A1I7X2T8_HETBA